MSDTPAANRRQVAQAETPDTIGAFPRLSGEQIDQGAALAERAVCQPAAPAEEAPAE